MASSIGPALTALDTVLATALPTVQKVVGEVGTFVAAEQYIVGDVTGSDRPATLVGGHPQTFVESYDVTVNLRSFAGGDDIAGRRDRGVAMKDAVRDGLAADPSMGGVVNQAYLATYTVRSGMDASGEGAAAEVDLTIHVDNLQP